MQNDIREIAPQWDYEELYFSGDEYFKNLLRAIHDAKTNIRFESYIFANDPIGQEVSYALCKASKRGVSTHIILDGAGSNAMSLTHREDLEKAGCRLKFYHPLPWQKVNLTSFGETQHLLSRIICSLQRLNKRNHRKLCIFDDRVAFIGSINITAVHSEYYSGKNAWRDTALRCEGPQVRKMIYAFERLWYKREVSRKNWRRYKDEHYYRPRHNIVRTNDTLLRRRFYLRDLVYRFNQAKTKIWITTPYFIPSKQHLKALSHAAQRGVDVRILLGEKSDVFLFKWLHVIFYYKLIKGGVKVFEYRPSIIHAKNILIDDWSTVGSSNFNNRSFIHDLEIDIVVTHRENLVLLEKQYQKDFSNSRQITLKEYRQISRIRIFLGRVFFLLRYWF